MNFTQNCLQIPKVNHNLVRDIMDIVIYKETDGEIEFGVHWSQEWKSYIFSYNGNEYLPNLSENVIRHCTLDILLQYIDIEIKSSFTHKVIYREEYENKNFSALDNFLSEIDYAKIDIYI